MKCVAIGGVPASGKTTLMRCILSELQPKSKFKYGLLRGYMKKDISILGIYHKNEVFAGTDKLSMAVQKDFDKYKAMENKHLLFEGDRLFTANNLMNLIQTHETRIVILHNDEKEIQARHEKRGDNQSEQFKKSRETKIKNITNCESLFDFIEFRTLSHIEESKRLAKDLSSYIEN